MAILKCKMCGGNLEISEGLTVCECEYCGTKQTIPSIEDENIQGLFNRANTLRMKAEFDRAEELYEKILQINESESEAYWGIILCKYGIEYVEDPSTFKRVPTCHRASFEAVLADEDYKAAIKYADVMQREIYESEARAIDEIQKGILDISKSEKPYDVFICYKETDENGKRTIDSTMANDIYYHLTQEGYKVFYAAITLEDKLGEEYEPYIFSALNTSKVMLVLGTKPEYFNAVWVKNEWSRFLKIIKQDRSKMLIPCYRDMDAYELPDEFAHLQAQDMGKLGFLQDLIRGVGKILRKSVQNEESPTASPFQAEASIPPVSSLIRRGYLFLEDGEWKSAFEYFDKVLDIEPENAEAYFGQLLAKRKAHSRDDLVNKNVSFDEDPLYLKTLRFADEDFHKILLRLGEENRRIMENNKQLEEESRRVAEDNRKLEVDKKRIEEENNWKKIENRRQEYIRTISIAKCISVGSSHVVGLKSDGTVVAVGRNNDGECNVSSWTDIKGISAYLHTVGLKNNGTVVATGSNRYGECNVSSWRDIVEIDTGPFYTVGLKNDGTVIAVGTNDDGQCNVSDWTDIVAISAQQHTVGLKKDGTVVATGLNDDGQCNVSAWEDIVAVVTGTYSTIGLKSDGTVVAVGRNKEGQCKVSAWKNIVAIAAEDYSTIGLKSDGTVVAVGRKKEGQCKVSSWKEIESIAIAADDDGPSHTVGLKKDGTVVAVGSNDEGQCDVSSWTNIVAIVAGDAHTIGLKGDGTIAVAGSFNYAQCNVSDWKLFQSVETLEQERKEFRERRAAEMVQKKAELERKKEELETEFVKLNGLFSGIRRKKLEAMISEIEHELNSL